MKICSIDGCQSSPSKKGLCNKHYLRQYRHGDPLHGKYKPRGEPNNCGAAICPAAKSISSHLDRLNNIERYKQVRKNYYIDNKEQENAYNLKYRIENSEKCRLISIRYQGQRFCAAPKWLSAEQKRQIQNIYYKSYLLKLETGTPHHVDHIVPLQGKTVCGLHVPWNLRAVPSEVNLRRRKIWSWDLQDC